MTITSNREIPPAFNSPEPPTGSSIYDSDGELDDFLKTIHIVGNSCDSLDAGDGNKDPDTQEIDEADENGPGSNTSTPCPKNDEDEQISDTSNKPYQPEEKTIQEGQNLINEEDVALEVEIHDSETESHSKNSDTRDGALPIRSSPNHPTNLMKL
ncbi:hypothetical protein QAD02_004354 [Eretmocerus hayati]|uniref:Uncharacterized protein n=1 Tax=Eretmocerus hayati TaxID=131215 RepID=A0ACC2NQE7_9HYME|nr:hypothetical protein QAD02_004354 [Eretmocerus hayati]